jgi:hypothetical protein
MKKLAVLALTTAALLQTQTAAAATAEACPDSYLATLPQWDRDSVSVTATDPSGRYQVAQVMNTASQLGVGLWRNGVPAEVIAAASGIYIQPTDVSVRADNVARVLPMPDGFNATTATDIDEDGVVVGYATLYDGNMPQKQQPVVWPAVGGYRLLQTTDADGWASAEAVRNGVAVGADGEAAVSWTLSDGTRTVIDADNANATEINAGGDVVVQKTPGLTDFGKVYHQSRQVNDCG